jgi:hypothetical protein
MIAIAAGGGERALTEGRPARQWQPSRLGYSKTPE